MESSAEVVSGAPSEGIRTLNERVDFISAASDVNVSCCVPVTPLKLSAATVFNFSVWLKLLLDVIGAAILLLVLSPLILLIALLLRSDGGPALFKHQRIGRNGRRFHCLKFRTMVVNPRQVLQEYLATYPSAAAEWRATQKLKNDPRVTRFGRVLRETSLDELPQLFNVLRFDMSLVGPRPIVEAELERYGEHAYLYLHARPGLTGLWQISGRSDTTYERRVELDAWYIRNWCLSRDIGILLRTVPTVLSRRGAR